MNRKVFWFNDRLDVYVLEPVAKGWNHVASKPVQRSVSNFFTNLRSPIVVVNDLLQGKVKNGASDVGRFAVNTTIGVLGFFDRATPLGLEQHVEDFGQTLGWWGVPAGPYLVRAHLQGYVPARARMVQVTTSSRDISIALTKVTGKSDAPRGAAFSH